jgi:hypothetical protein
MPIKVSKPVLQNVVIANNTQEINVPSGRLKIAIVNITFPSSSTNATVTLYDIDNNQLFSIPIKNSNILSLRYVQLSRITISDSASYTATAVITSISVSTEDELHAYLAQQAIYTTTPNNTQVSITSPLTTNNSVQTGKQTVVTTSNPFTISFQNASKVYIQLSGSNAVATITINGTAYNLNAGASLASGSLYEFEVHVNNGDTITLAGATFIRAIIVGDE